VSGTRLPFVGASVRTGQSLPDAWATAGDGVSLVWLPRSIPSACAIAGDTLSVRAMPGVLWHAVARIAAGEPNADEGIDSADAGVD
jgi:hypothetical protein